MKFLLLTNIFVTCLIGLSCNVQSGITQKSLEKFNPTPTPIPVATMAPDVIDPADVVSIDLSVALASMPTQRI